MIIEIIQTLQHAIGLCLLVDTEKKKLGHSHQVILGLW